MKVGKNLVDLEEAIRINTSSKMRVFETPMGAEPGKTQTVAGKSVPWKLVKGEAFKQAFPNQYANLGKAVEIGKKYNGIKGLAYLTYRATGKTILTSKRAAMMAVGEHPDAYEVVEVSGAPQKYWRKATPRKVPAIY